MHLHFNFYIAPFLVLIASMLSGVLSKFKSNLKCYSKFVFPSFLHSILLCQPIANQDTNLGSGSFFAIFYTLSILTEILLFCLNSEDKTSSSYYYYYYIIIIIISLIQFFPLADLIPIFNHKASNNK